MISALSPERLFLRKTTTWLRVLCVLGWLTGFAALDGAEGKPPAPDFPAPKDRAEANHQDLAYLRTVMTYDQSFSKEARAAFDTAVGELDRRAGELDPAELELEVARVLALANNGHTNARGATRGHALNSIPVRFAWFAEGLIVVKVRPEFAALLGARLEAIEGRPLDEVARRLRVFVGGADPLAHALLPHLLQSPQALHAAGLAASPGELILRVRLRDGNVVDRTVAADPKPAVPADRNDWPARSLSPVPIPGDSRQWTHLLDGSSANVPLFLQQPDTPYWQAWVDDLKTVFVQINTTRTRGDVALDRFLERTLDEVKRRGVHHAIVDLRFNSGGNYQLVADFSENLPKVLPPGGKIFILTSPNTFSAAIVMVARLKYFAGPRGLIVGEPMGDREQFWAEGETVRLPNSKIPVRYSNGYHDWENGPRSAIPQHGANRRYGVAAGKLAPDIAAPLRLDDYLAGRDTAFEAIRASLPIPVDGRLPQER